jgi:hypothetical protein
VEIAMRIECKATDEEMGICGGCGVSASDALGEYSPDEFFVCVECQWDDEHDTHDEQCKCKATGKEVYMPKFEIQTIYDGQWSTECLGEATVFASEYDAEKAIAELKQLGDDWLDGEYRVVAIRDEVGK